MTFLLRALKMFVTFKARELANTRFGTPPCDRRFNQPHSQTREVFVDQLFSLRLAERRHAETKIGARDFNEVCRQSACNCTDDSTQRHQEWIRQRFEESKKSE